MANSPDLTRKKFGPLRDKSLKNAIAHQISKQFPRIGGPRITALCADIVLEVLDKHLFPRQHLTHGQVIWLGISINDPPSRGKTIAQTDLVPVVLDLSTNDDIEARLERKSAKSRTLQKALRLCKQAYKQGALLSNCDIAEILNTYDTLVATLLSDYQRETGKVVPRRATLHDVGSGVTHKRIICWKRYAEGKTSDVIARETYHSMESVDRYLGQYDRVRNLLLEKMGIEQIAYTLNCSLALVQEYFHIDKELENKNKNNIN